MNIIQDGLCCRTPYTGEGAIDFKAEDPGFLVCCKYVID